MNTLPFKAPCWCLRDDPTGWPLAHDWAVSWQKTLRRAGIPTRECPDAMGVEGGQFHMPAWVDSLVDQAYFLNLGASLGRRVDAVGRVVKRLGGESAVAAAVALGGVGSLRPLLMEELSRAATTPRRRRKK